MSPTLRVGKGHGQAFKSGRLADNHSSYCVGIIVNSLDVITCWERSAYPIPYPLSKPLKITTKSQTNTSRHDSNNLEVVVSLYTFFFFKKNDIQVGCLKST